LNRRAKRHRRSGEFPKRFAISYTATSNATAAIIWPDPNEVAKDERRDLSDKYCYTCTLTRVEDHLT
jgi:hypothetical protein